MNNENKINFILLVCALFFVAWVGGCSLEHYKADREDSWEDAEKWEASYRLCEDEKGKETTSSMTYARRAWEQMESTTSCLIELSACKEVRNETNKRNKR